MNAHLLFRKPARARGSERGAALFLVILVVSLLTAVGIFAARSASLVDMAAGYDRQAVQTQYAAAYGQRLALANLTANSGHWIQMLKKQESRDYLAPKSDPSVEPPSPCESTQGVVMPDGLPAPCVRKMMKYYADEVNVNFGGQQLYQIPAAPNPGSLGPFDPATGAALEATFYVEISDAGAAGPATGNSGGGQGSASVSPSVEFSRAVVTTVAQVRPYRGANVSCDLSAMAASGLQTVRAHAMVKTSTQ